MPVRNQRPLVLLLSEMSIFHGSICKEAFLSNNDRRLLLVIRQKIGDMDCDTSTRHIMCYAIIFLPSHFFVIT